MKTIIVSPHTDDAIFSLGSLISYITDTEDVTILSVFAGIPQDQAGKAKHTRLRQEHRAACERLRVQEINGEFLDDVYPDRDLFGLKTFLQIHTQGFDNIYIPMGIHHPDHALIRHMYNTQSGLRHTHIYEELPYRMLYPDWSVFEKHKLEPEYELSVYGKSHEKYMAVDRYQSQIDDKVIDNLMVQEYVWKKK